MKRKIFWLLVVMAVVMFGTAVLNGTAQDEEFDWEKNYFGKAVGWITDPDTNEPVKEQFNIRFFFISPDVDPSNPLYLDTTSDNKGFFSRKLYPGKYYIYAIPVKHGKYCEDADPYIEPGSAHVIEIKKDQITKIYKKANIGGNLKVILVGPNGQRLDTQEVFNGRDFSVNIRKNKSYLGVTINDKINPSSDKAEFFFENEAPGQYTVRFGSKAGIVTQKVKNVIIEKRKTTEFKLSIDIDTGIEGIITNEKGEPIDYVWVDIESSTDPTISAMVFTDKNGYYRFFGLIEGYYDIRYSIDDENDNFYGNSEKRLFIKNGIIIKKDLVINMTKPL